MPRGGTLIFSCIRRIGPFSFSHIYYYFFFFFGGGGGFKSLNFNIFGGFRKMSIFWGMKILWIFFIFFLFLFFGKQ